MTVNFKRVLRQQKEVRRKLKTEEKKNLSIQNEVGVFFLKKSIESDENMIIRKNNPKSRKKMTGWLNAICSLQI